jgi:hypothetical protein
LRSQATILARYHWLSRQPASDILNGQLRGLAFALGAIGFEGKLP